MAGDTVITVIGNLTSDVELTFIPAGDAVAHFTVASTPRVFDRNTNQWRDGEAMFLRCNIWREAAENVAESLTKGARVIVAGRLKQRSYQTRDGDKRTVFELEVDEVGPSLRFAQAQVTRTGRRPNNGNGFGADTTTTRTNRAADSTATAPHSDASDPWATSAPAARGSQAWAEPALASVGVSAFGQPPL
ncbi:single-stranded DNA-binding protein [Nocardia asteroides]|uniref:single-stranded DNA-binding protein n=1 Tax=Nocardia asteroides TaxID=1824 RepID=UPI001E2AFDD2|nr:single-stranded DNA-binding protein [Nocardia asteroides]UGT55061.1 single-stranded DNA-binding protein [Nocardia asteroides]